MGCGLITIGTSCYSNTFGNNGLSITFGVNCYSNTFGDDCYYNTFGDNCNSNTFGNGCTSNNFYHGLSGTTPKNYIRYIVLEDGVQNNNFYSNVVTGTGAFLQRIRISGLENDGTTKTTITLPSTNTNYDWVVAKNSSGIVQQYCPENLVP